MQALFELKKSLGNGERYREFNWRSGNNFMQDFDYLTGVILLL